MALIKFGGGITHMSGSIAGNTFARNRFGSYVRSRTKPVNPNTVLQNQTRSRIGFLTQYWRATLTAPERTAWETYAASIAWLNKLGEATYLTGFNMFVGCNSNRLWAEKPLVAAGPTVLALPENDPTISVTATVLPPYLSIAYDDTLPWCTDPQAYLVASMGEPQSKTRNFFAGPWKYIGRTLGNSGTPPDSPWTTAAPYTLVLGQKSWFKFRIGRGDGRISREFAASAIVTAGTP